MKSRFSNTQRQMLARLSAKPVSCKALSPSQERTLQSLIRAKLVVKNDSEYRLVEQEQPIIAVWCDLECGHHVVLFYSHRRSYTHANCLWCTKEKREGVKYVWMYSPYGSTYVAKKN